MYCNWKNCPQSRLDRLHKPDPWYWPWPTTFTFNPLRAMVMTYSRANIQWSVCSEDGMEENGQPDGGDSITSLLMLSVTNDNKYSERLCLLLKLSFILVLYRSLYCNCSLILNQFLIFVFGFGGFETKFWISFLVQFLRPVRWLFASLITNFLTTVLLFLFFTHL